MYIILERHITHCRVHEAAVRLRTQKCIVNNYRPICTT